MVEYKDRLEIAMKKASVSVTALADHLKISYQGVKKVINGTTAAFTAANNSKAAKFLGVSPDWLATGDGDASRTLVVSESLPAYTVITVEQAIDVLSDALLRLQEQDSVEAAALFMQKMASDPNGRWAGLLRDLLQKEAGVNGEGKRDTKVVSKKIAAVHNDQGPLLGTALSDAENPVIEGEGRNASGRNKSSGAQVHQRSKGT